MAVNIWGAGQDALTDFLVKRDEKTRLEEDRARRSQLDEEARAQRAADLEIRSRQVGTDEERVKASVAETERRNRQTDSDKARRLELMAVLSDDTQPRPLRAKAALELSTLGAGALADNVLNPPREIPTTKPVYRMGRDGKMVKVEDVDANAVITNEPAPTREPAPPRGVTPGQILQAKRQAVADARAAFRDPLNQPEGTVEQMAKQLEQEYLTTLGVDVPDAAAAPVAPPEPTAAFASDPMTADLPPLRKRAVPGAARQDLPSGAGAGASQQMPIPGIPGGVAELRDGKWIRVK